jgi:membrane protease YdiL (CAAX protease family)
MRNLYNAAIEVTAMDEKIFFSALNQSEDLGTDLVNRYLEWSHQHVALLKTLIAAIVVLDILLILAAVVKKEWILTQLRGHDTTEKWFIISFFVTAILGISLFGVVLASVGLQAVEGPNLGLLLVMAGIVMIFIFAILICLITFVVLFSRLFIFAKPTNPVISDDVNWGGTPVLVVALAFLVVSTFLAFFSGTLSSIVGSVVFIMLPIFLVRKTYERTLAVMEFKKPIMRILLLSLPLVPLLILGNEAVYRITEKFMGQFPLNELVEDVISGDPIIMSVHLGILGPIGEEIFFRGFAHKTLKRKYGLKKGIILSSLFFGIYHGIPWQIPYAFAAGCILAYVYEKTQSIYTPILFHIINNTVAVLEIWM